MTAALISAAAAAIADAIRAMFERYGVKTGGT